MIKFLVTFFLISINIGAVKALNFPPDAVMDDPWQSLSIGYEEGFLGAFCELEKRGALSRERLKQLNVEIYQASTIEAEKECQPPNCEIGDFTNEELDYMNKSIAEAGCAWLKHPETREKQIAPLFK